MKSKAAKFLIEAYQLEAHPEGGYFKRTFASKDVVKVNDRYEEQNRLASSHIYYLLEDDDFSAFHRIKSDEHWHFYVGDNLILYVLDRQKNLQQIILGNPLLTEGAVFHHCIEQGQWFAASTDAKNSYSFIGCTVAPGFEERDWELAAREKLISEYPQYQDLITRYTYA
jgi:predicted cupin superfamily sugar epimerase